MIYVYYGLETFLIEKEIQKCFTKANIEPINVSRYNMEETPLKDVIEDAMMTSLFSDKKGIVCERSTFLTGSTKFEQDTSLLEEYCGHINPDTILIFFVPAEKLDERKRIVKTLKKVASIHSFSKNEMNFSKLLNELFEGYEISNPDKALFLMRVGKEIPLLEQEAEKIKMYRLEDKKITKDDIVNLTTKNIDLDIFHLIESIVSKKKEKAMESYYEMLKRNEEPIKIIIILANQFRIMYQAKCLSQKGYTEKDIASTLGIHPYRIKLALQNGRSFKKETLLSYLEKLADLDTNIKMGKIDSSLGLELFILGI